jgi:NADPH-dependent 2,4-dienoyl-CoA reductase/sulfur reductase-like enzyme/nitrite reductase/ring-hydroxylating ferredoxin subunit
MNNHTWLKVAKVSDLEESIPVKVMFNDQEVFLVKREGVLYACGNKCMHYGGPLNEGLLKEHIVTCPWHNAKYDIRTCKMIAPPALEDLPSYAIKLEGGDIFLQPSPAQEANRKKLKTNRVKEKIVILGAGAAGNAAAETLRREGFSGKIFLVTQEEDLPYDRPKLSKSYLVGKVTDAEMPLRTASFYKDQEIEILTKHKATAVDPGQKNISFENQSSLDYHKLLLATGGIPRRPDIEGFHLKGCFLLRSLVDGKKIMHHLENARHAVLLGGGFISIEVAAALRERGLKVDVITHEKLPMLKQFGERIAHWIKTTHEEKGVRFHMETQIEAIKGNGAVEEVILNDGTHLPADLVIAGVGIVPAIEYLKSTNLVEGNAVLTDENLRTQAPDIYAAGDIALYYHPTANQRIRVEHWVAAERQGRHAARAMLGKTSAFEDIPFFWTMQFGRSIQYLGYGAGYEQIAYQGSVENGNFLAAFYNKAGQVIACAGCEREKDMIAAEEIIRYRLTIPPQKWEEMTSSINPGVGYGFL